MADVKVGVVLGDMVILRTGGEDRVGICDASREFGRVDLPWADSGGVEESGESPALFREDGPGEGVLEGRLRDSALTEVVSLKPFAIQLPDEIALGDSGLLAGVRLKNGCRVTGEIGPLVG